MDDLQWMVYVQDEKSTKLKAGFVSEMDAMEYVDMIKGINRLAGYRDKYIIKKNDDM